MKPERSNYSRRNFIKKITTASIALQGVFLLESFGFKASGVKKIFLPKNSQLPVYTAAEILAKKIGAKIILEAHTGAVKSGEIIFQVGDGVKNYPEASSLITGADLSKEWEVVKKIDDGFLFSGSSSRNLCHAVLAWIENPGRETDRFSNYRFAERYTMWDNSLNQWFRFSKGFDREAHVYEIARLGFTGMEINRYADAGGFHVNHRRFPDDPYAWYMSYAPALDAFVESSYTKDIYPKDELTANLNDLKEAAELSRKYGLKPGFVCYEPRGVSEKVFDRHPGLRGARIDHPGRSLEPRYSLDIANPKVLDHYAESITKLMEIVPDLSYFVFWTQDSGSGMPFSKGLYAGPNGSYLARSKTLGEMAGNFMKTLVNAGRKINPEFEVVMKMDWEYFDDERNEMTAHVPEGATLVHVFGNRSIKGSNIKGEIKYVTDDRKVGIEPYAAIIVSASWETEPIVGITRPSILAEKVKNLTNLELKKIMAQGGIFSKFICPYNITQELFLELIRTEVNDLDKFIYDTAKVWCNNDDKVTKELVKAWQVADKALEAWPVLNWYDSGAGTTQGRWLTRPLVPDITLLDKSETFAWERELFPVPWDVARKNIAFEGGIRMYTEGQLDKAVKAFDNGMFPKLQESIKILKNASKSKINIIIDQHDRYLSFLYRSISVRNLYEAQLAINNYLMKKGSQVENQKSLKKAIYSEIKNTENWIDLLETSKVYFFRITDNDETPFQYKTPIEDFKLKLKVMKGHLEDKPGPYITELFDKGSERNLLFYE